MAFSWCTRPSSACRKYVPSGNTWAWADRTEHFAQRVGLRPRPYCDVSGAMLIPNSTLYSTPVACAGTNRPRPLTFSLIDGLMREANVGCTKLRRYSTSKRVKPQGMIPLSVTIHGNYMLIKGLELDHRFGRGVAKCCDPSFSPRIEKTKVAGARRVASIVRSVA